MVIRLFFYFGYGINLSVTLTTYAKIMQNQMVIGLYEILQRVKNTDRPVHEADYEIKYIIIV